MKSKTKILDMIFFNCKISIRNTLGTVQGEGGGVGDKKKDRVT